MSETSVCPKCGAERERSGQSNWISKRWACGSTVYESPVLYVSDVVNLKQSDRCKITCLTRELAESQAECERLVADHNKVYLVLFKASSCRPLDVLELAEAIVAERDALQKFKTFVHATLDKMGVPENPNPERTAETKARCSGIRT